MRKGLVLTATIGILAATITFADQTSKVVIPAGKTAPNDARQMYTNYCAPCHGVDGKGKGPVAPAMKSSPTDLTQLTRNNHGKYPDTHVVAVLQFGSTLSSHGSAAMPVWGPIFGNMSRTNVQEKQLRISNLAHYLESIQQP
ncbi:c-type cytochrome [Occallatibacter savannae]|uniref:c-type cytochrome n=1 Tax=Occallatibacter savannae TaxID=1002691 RepID=UPI000D68F161|nr:c-type cytochrome [Occallatibacter savannae]